MVDRLQSAVNSLDLSPSAPLKSNSKISSRRSPSSHPLSIMNHHTHSSHLPDHLADKRSSMGSPTFTVEDFSRSPFSPVGVTDLSSSPQRYVVGGAKTRERSFEKSGSADRLSVSPLGRDSGGEEELIHASPSSPLLTAVREAVDSLSQFEDFEIIEKIGAGFFAEVFKVRHIPTDQVMVLKLNKRMNGLKKLKEVELLKRLSHPNILHYVGACIHEGQVHPLTEYVNGGALEQLIQDHSVDMPWCLRHQLALDIAQGMEYLHANDMLHRDLNSKNCLLRKQGSKYTAVVADFGLAASAPKMIRSMTRSQSIVGSPFWMAPEVLSGKVYNEKADVFSYGIVLCELISRLEADPDEIPRTRDFGLDREKFCKLPEVLKSKCSTEFMDLAFQCCRLLPLERPTFTAVKTSLVVMAELFASDSATCEYVDSPVSPQPSDRLSFHDAHYRGTSPIPKETVV